ncbi:fimbrial protein [Scandinavium sp. TWS1a]|uniref:fimbrial protein n=1 Tax=Scandinavium tedordense TaxID=2926521 RepID=UPI0021659A4E|nr:fimbrial protein [Scandinavium tedordense]MCS2169600.1 fimbrial protein [Scandinavium tedordense]
MARVILFICCALLFCTKSALATCTLNAPADTATMPLLMPNITAGNDLADGSILYHQQYNLDYTGGSSWITVTCSTTNLIMANYGFSQTPLPASSWGTGQLAGKVYETGVPGIGVYFQQNTNSTLYVADSKPATKEENNGSVCEGSTTCRVIGNLKRWDVYFVKTGTISPGTVTGGNLPCLTLNYTNEGNSASNLVENVCLSGSINVIAGTCQTPNVDVDMGKYDISQFSGKGSFQKWTDASIKLVNCPVFYGSNSSGTWSSDATSSSSGGTPKNNTLELSLTPNTSVIDSANGIFDITNGTGSAQGVGIQLAYGTAAGNIDFVDFSQTKSYQIDLNTTGVSTIPLVARYIQTGNGVQPGLANSAVTFLINYY